MEAHEIVDEAQRALEREGARVSSMGALRRVLASAVRRAEQAGFERGRAQARKELADELEAVSAQLHAIRARIRLDG